MTEITLLKTGEKVKFYSIKEAASLLNVSVPTINRWIRANKINNSRFGNGICFAETEIMRLQQQCLQGANITKDRK